MTNTLAHIGSSVLANASIMPDVIIGDLCVCVSVCAGGGFMGTLVRCCSFDKLCLTLFDPMDYIARQPSLSFPIS